MSDWKAPNLEALCGSFLILTFGFTGLRLYNRKKQGVPVLLDDIFMVLATLTFLGTCICVFISIDHRILGYPTPLDFAVQTTKLSELLLTAIQFISWANLAFVKLSALFFYKRIFDTPGRSMRTFRIILWTSIALVAIWFVSFMFVTGLQCGTHWSALWADPETHAEYCTILLPSTYGGVIIDVILDVWIIALPLPWIYRLHMDRTKKFATMGIFLLMAAGLGASIARMVVYIQFASLGYEQLIKLDLRRFDSRLYFYYILECGLAIVAVNLPVMATTLFRSIPMAIAARARIITNSIRSLSQRSQRSNATRDETAAMEESRIVDNTTGHHENGMRLGNMTYVKGAAYDSGNSRHKDSF